MTPLPTHTFDLTWHDASRNRDVPARVYFPAQPAGPAPVVIFSHGLGGSREHYQYLGRHWAGRGYVSVHLNHAGSDTEAVLANGLANTGRTGSEIARNPRNAIDRCFDVSFAIDRLPAVNADTGSPLPGRLDPSRVAVAGHSFGGNTAMLIAGQVFLPDLRHAPYQDRRVRCAIAMSPPTVLSPVNYARSYGPIAIPVMVMSGTLDNAPIGPTAHADRVAAFDSLNGAPAVLVVLKGADHHVFVGDRPDPAPPAESDHPALICDLTTTFLDAFLKAESSATGRLKSPDLRRRAAHAGAEIKVSFPAEP